MKSYIDLGGDQAGARTMAVLLADYAEAEHAHNDGMGAWMWRVAYSAQTMSLDEAIRKHQIEWRQGLGLHDLPTPPNTALDRLTARSHVFWLPNGRLWRWKLVTAFDAFHVFTRGEHGQLTEFLDWVLRVGANGVRVFGGWSVTGFDYRQTPDYFEAMDEFFEFCGTRGLRVEFAAITDSIPPDLDRQQWFLHHCANIADGHRHVFFQFGNEPFKNGFEPIARELYLPHDRLLISRGAAAPNAEPYRPSLGYTTIHPPRMTDWYRRPGKDCFDLRAVTGDVIVPDEPMGYAETRVPGRRTNDPSEAFRAGISAAMFTVGMTAHGDSHTLQLARIPGPQEEACVRETFRAIDLVPADAPLWRYGRYGPSNPGIPMPVEEDLSSPDPDRRMHAMIGSSEAVACNYQPSRDWIARGTNGWHVDHQEGPYVYCRR